MKVITTTRIEITPEEESIIKNFEGMLYEWQLNIDDKSNTSADLGELTKAVDTCFDALGDLLEQINETKEMEW